MIDNIEFRIMTIEDYPLVKKMLTESFYTGEPLCMSSGENPEKYAEKDIDDYNLELIRCGTSLLALQNGKIVGSVVAGTQVSSDVQGNYEEAEKAGDNIYGRMLRFLSKLERDANIYERYNVSKALFSDKTTVDKDMRGKGLGSMLAARLIEIGREKGYPLVLAYCTNYYSARQKEALGMEVAHSMDYANYKDENGRVVFNPPKPHTCAKVMAMRL